MAVSVRQVCVEDFDEILKINSESGPGVVTLDEKELRRVFSLSSVSLVATEADQVVGYLLGNSSSDPYDCEEIQFFRTALHQPFWYINQVAVGAKARRTGIASRMYGDLLRRCRNLNIATLCCEVNLRPANPASLRFHERLGFARVREIKTADGRLAVLMLKHLLAVAGQHDSSPAFSRITRVTEQDLPRLFEVWESSVRASHSFLTEFDIQSLIPFVKAELANFDPIYCLRASDGRPFAMLGVQGSKIEMLFVHADNRGGGAGRLLTGFATQVLGAAAVDVNEQNDPAIRFYEHLGFRKIDRSPLDSAGRPFPILHMALRPARPVVPDPAKT